MICGQQICGFESWLLCFCAPTIGEFFSCAAVRKQYNLVADSAALEYMQKVVKSRKETHIMDSVKMNVCVCALQLDHVRQMWPMEVIYYWTNVVNSHVSHLLINQL